MKIPFVQSVTTVPKYQMNYKLSEAEINTKDKRRIIIDNYAVWRVVNAKEMISSAGTLSWCRFSYGRIHLFSCTF